MANNNGNVCESYWSKQRKPDWSSVVALCTLILALLGVVYYAIDKITDLKIELAKRDAKIFILESQKHHRITPSGY